MRHSLAGELAAAERIARQAGAAVLSFYGSATADPGTANSPVTAADRAANDLIVRSLRSQFPADAILSEESADSPDRLQARRVWIVDPLDGTKEFLARNGEFSVMIALALDGQPAVGAVYLPADDSLYSAAIGAGAHVCRGGERARLNRDEPALDGIRLVGSRSHSDPLVARLATELGITDVEPCGSVGVKCARIAEDRRDLYVHPVPYIKEWDTCAPEVIAREAGCHVSDCRGEELVYNKQDPRQPHGVVVSAQACAGRALSALRTLYQDVEA